MPKYICTCCHLDLYHSLAFRERCLKTEYFLQAARPKPKTGDPLNTSQTGIESRHESINESNKLQFAATTVQLDNLILNTPDTDILSQECPQRRILRVRTQKTNTRAKFINIKKTNSHDHNSRKTMPAIPQPNPKDQDANEVQSSKNSPLSSPSKCEKSSCTSKNKINEVSDFEETKMFQEAPLDKVPFTPSSPVISSEFESQSAQGKDSMVAKRQSRQNKVNNVKPPANPKVFICDLCGHQSSSPKNLDLHILRHKGEKNFECAECGIKHYSKYLLKLHIRVKHQGEMPYLCKFCDQRFYSASTRQRHEQ